MKIIKPFSMKVTEEQSEIVQKVLFRNGYSWINGSTNVMQLDKEYLVFSNTVTNKCFLCWNNVYSDDEDTPATTFEQFIICERKEKLEKLNGRF